MYLAYFGDDFTGSTDALEFLSRAGLRTMLFIDTPTAEQLTAYPDLDAIGVAGLTRSMAPEPMEAILSKAFPLLKALDVRHVHYKVCSTFDSSPTTGSIGRAIETGLAVFKQAFVPVLVAAPALGRYSIFGNLFARMGIGSQGAIYRLDRHPSMSKHPVTPADESDLRLHLARQTPLKSGLLDMLQIAKGQAVMRQEADRQVADGTRVLFIDALDTEQLCTIGAWLDTGIDAPKPVFSVGSSGIEMALGAYWNQTGDISSETDWPVIGPAEPLLVISGSCSPIATRQIQVAIDNGFAEILVPVADLAHEEATSRLMREVMATALPLLLRQQSVVIHSAGEQAGKANAVPAERLGTTLGRIARQLVGASATKRVVVAGGDTSSYAARAMGIEAVRMLAPLVPGAPLCTAIAPDSPLHGLEVNFKGGQVGSDDYFCLLRQGSAQNSV
ncbi:four-carbon acid sugar kinase family protein [Arsenicibacter rosenii]|uniref:Serine kinase n=1 Tax=Arsenicibacter rosenii TaxID=1750698 RepID=A0A1S2VA31_9BACT|nr:four-carbon acid sugar kinase family protein [Arsenicibacter rosenii]OIN55573.1 serine kinase [Arsenicibacter rosenii]